MFESRDGFENSRLAAACTPHQHAVGAGWHSEGSVPQHELARANGEFLYNNHKTGQLDRKTTSAPGAGEDQYDDGGCHHD